MNYRIVRASLDQMPEVAKLFRRSFRDVYPNCPDLHTAEEDQAYFVSVVFPNTSVYVAQDIKTNQISGFIAFRPDLVEHLYVAPEAQGQKIGCRLMALAMANTNKLQLWTFQQNKRARAFYKKNGFVELKMTDGAATEEKQPDVLLEWRRFTE